MSVLVAEQAPKSTEPEYDLDGRPSSRKKGSDAEQAKKKKKKKTKKQAGEAKDVTNYTELRVNPAFSLP